MRASNPAEPLELFVVFGFDAIGGGQNDHAYDGVQAPLTHYPARRLGKLRVREHRQEETTVAWGAILMRATCG